MHIDFVIKQSSIKYPRSKARNQVSALPSPIAEHLLQLLWKAAPLLGRNISWLVDHRRVEQSLAVNLGMVMTKVQGKVVIP